jgi:hypothetical protein
MYIIMMRQLKGGMKIKCKEKVTNDEINKRSALTPMAHILTEWNLRWMDHILHRDTNRLPRQLLLSQLSTGKRDHGRPRLRFQDVV